MSTPLVSNRTVPPSLVIAPSKSTSPAKFDEPDIAREPPDIELVTAKVSPTVINPLTFISSVSVISSRIFKLSKYPTLHLALLEPKSFVLLPLGIISVATTPLIVTVSVPALPRVELPFIVKSDDAVILVKEPALALTVWPVSKFKLPSIVTSPNTVREFVPEESPSAPRVMFLPTILSM